MSIPGQRFLGGLMVGRTPEFVTKRINPGEMKYVALYYLSGPLVLLTGTAIAIERPGERASMNNTGAHGFSEVLYAFTSAANSDGSAFAGLNGNTTWYNVVLAFVMLLGRYLPMIFVLRARPHRRQTALSGIYYSTAGSACSHQIVLPAVP